MLSSLGNIEDALRQERCQASNRTAVMLDRMSRKMVSAFGSRHPGQTPKWGMSRARLDVAADAKPTHRAAVKVTQLGEAGGLWAVDVDL
jgi:hypothetical protein